MNDRTDGFDRPTPEQWRAACPSLAPQGREMVRPCPHCGGRDRFHVRADGVFDCRGCHDFKAILEEAGFILDRQDGFDRSGRASGTCGINRTNWSTG